MPAISGEAKVRRLNPMNLEKCRLASRENFAYSMAVKELFSICGLFLFSLGCSSAGKNNPTKVYDETLKECFNLGAPSERACRNMFSCTSSMSKAECGEILIKDRDNN